MRISDWISDVCSSDLLQPCSCSGCARASSPRWSDWGLAHARRISRPRQGRSWLLLSRFWRSLCSISESTASIWWERSRKACRPLRCLPPIRSEEHTSELQSLMRISYAVFCLKKKNTHTFTEQNYNQEFYTQ